MQVELRPRSMGEQFGLTFSLASAHFVRLFLITFVTSLPITLLQHYGNSTREQVAIGGKTFDAPSTATILLMFLVLVLSLVVGPLQMGASILLVSDSFTGERHTLGQSVGVALRRIRALLGYVFLLSLMLIVGFILLFVPFFVFLTWYYVGGPTVMLESLSGRQSLARSKQLTEGSRMSIFWFMIALSVLSLAFTWGAGSVAGVVLGLIGVPPGSWVLIVVESMLAAIGGVPTTVGPIVVYFNQRVVREAFDLKTLASWVDAIGKRQPTGQPVA